ncbi:MAG: hypothetical protein ACYCT2_04385 [Thermoplasmataceae archaeon]
MSKKINEFEELTREIARKEYNVSRRDEILLVDLHASLQADIIKAMQEMRQCAMIIRTAEFGVNQYLHDAYVRASNMYQSLTGEWEKYFPGESPVKVAVPVPVGWGPWGAF